MPPPSSTVDALPSVNPGTYSIDSTSQIKTGGHKGSIQTKGSGKLTGDPYTGLAKDGPAAYFLFGSDTAYDESRSFDASFGSQGLQSFPTTAGVAVLEFQALTINGAPQFKIAGGPPDPKDVALVAASTITSSPGLPFSIDLSPVNSLFLGTINGSISLQAAGFSASPGNFKFLSIYARGGASSVSLGDGISLPGASLFVDAPGNVNLLPTASVNAGAVILNGGGAVTVGGSITAQTLQVFSGGAAALNQNGGSVQIMNLFAPSLAVMASQTVLGGRLEVGAGGISAGAYDLLGFDAIDVNGAITAGSLSASGGITASGAIRSADLTVAHSILASSIVALGGIDYSGHASALFTPPTAGGSLTLLAPQVLVDAGGINGVNMNGGDASALSGFAGGSGGSLNIGTSGTPIPGSITVNAPITATSGANATALFTGGAGGNVSLVSAGTVNVGAVVKVSDSTAGRASRSGGNISIDSRSTAGTAISVTNSAQLLSLLSGAAPGPGGTIKFSSAGGAVNVNGGTIRADRGTVDVRNNGANGAVNLTNANLNADVVKIGALGAGGQLVINGGTISANTAIELYAPGSNGQVLFNGNVTLGGASMKTIAGDTVTVANGGVVSVGGSVPASVFTNRANYTGSGGNASTSGRFGGAGATTAPLGGAPKF